MAFRWLPSHADVQRKGRAALGPNADGGRRTAKGRGQDRHEICKGQTKSANAKTKAQTKATDGGQNKNKNTNTDRRTKRKQEREDRTKTKTRTQTQTQTQNQNTNTKQERKDKTETETKGQNENKTRRRKRYANFIPHRKTKTTAPPGGPDDKRQSQSQKLAPKLQR
jgi:hypothetical protein